VITFVVPLNHMDTGIFIGKDMKILILKWVTSVHMIGGSPGLRRVSLASPLVANHVEFGS
jgi:hypothetical protein